MKRIIQKLKSSAGLSLAETLLAVAMLVLGMSIVAAGMPAALNAYRNAIDAANAQVLLSETVNALRSELSTAREVKAAEDGNGVTYYNNVTGSRSRLYLDASAEGCRIMLQEYDDHDDALSVTGETLNPDLKPNERPLVAREMARTTKNKNEYMTVSCGSISPSADGRTVTVTELLVKRDEATMAEIPSDSSLTIRVLSGGAGA